MKKRILISDAMHPSIVTTLSDLGFDVDYFPEIDRQKIIEELHNYYGLLIRSKTHINKELIDSGKNLKFIARAGAGLDQIDLKYANQKNIEVINAPEGNRDAVGEHAVGLLLNLLNHMSRADKQIRKRQWLREENRGVELMEKTVAIIGYGNMGKAFAERLVGFQCNVLAYDKYKSDFGDANVKEATMNEIFEQADVLSFHLPLTDETNRMADDAFFSQFKKNIYLINTARGEIIPLKTLLNQLLLGKIIAAGLDVLENEKFDKLMYEQDEILKELFNMENIIFTPHVAGWSKESYIKINQTLVKKIKQFKLD